MCYNNYITQQHRDTDPAADIDEDPYPNLVIARDPDLAT